MWSMIGVAFFRGQRYFSNLSSLSAGLSFILRPGLTPESCVFLEIVKGRFISLELVINNFHFTLFNVYAPCESAERRAFFASVIYHLQTVDPNHCVCIGGDFNCTFDPKIDRNTAEPHPESCIDLSLYFSHVGLLDIWREFYPNELQFTWSRITGGRVSFARLDRWYINSRFRNIVVSPDFFFHQYSQTII